ncbi:retrograde transport [Mactra antiquata]
MAEGGEESDKDNPFSFKSFVTKKDKKPKDNNKVGDDDDIDIFSMTDAGTTRKRDKQKQIVVVDEVHEAATKTSGKKKGKSENPFSFKKFLSGSNPKDSENRSSVQQQNHDRLVPNTSHDRLAPRSSQNNSLSVTNERQNVPNLHVAGDLPDFVQDHYTEGMSTSPRGIELPDFTIRDITESGSDLRRNVSLSQYTVPVVNDCLPLRENEAGDDFDDISDSEENVSVPQGSLVNSLPDFLSDAAVSSTLSSVQPVINNSSRITNHSRLPDQQSSISQENRKLLDENERLKRHVEELTAQRTQDINSISELQRQLVEQKKKEVEETAAMEQAMIQVEENLSVTTKRAIQAESTVTKLKQEVKTLQTELKALRGENGILPADRLLHDVKERTSYVAEQLSSATKTAESSLKQLLSGVDNLKLLSQVLTSIDKISEDTTTSDTKNNNSTAS